MNTKKISQLNIWDMMGKDLVNPDQEIDIKGAINLKASPICDHEVRVSYGDLTLIIAVLRDYVRGFDKLFEMGEAPINTFEYEAYYREKFLSIAEKISKQIDYDYDKKFAQCHKKLEKNSGSDVGEEALSLMLKRGKM